MNIFSIPLRLLVICLVTPVAVNGHETETQLPFERPHAHESVEWHAHLGWESRYFSEGRDALDGDSLFVGTIETGWRHFAGGIWYGRSRALVWIGTMRFRGTTN